jgi:hypothetical protein
MPDTPQQPATVRAAAAACRPSSPLQAAAAAPLWRALSDESAIWLLATLSPGPENKERPAAAGLSEYNR